VVSDSSTMSKETFAMASTDPRHESPKTEKSETPKSDPKPSFKRGQLVWLSHPVHGEHPAVVRAVRDDGLLDLEVLNTAGGLTEVDASLVSKV
jgi:hypothetical protein